MLRFRPVPAASGAGCRRNCAPLFRMNLLQLYEDLATRERLDFCRGRSVSEATSGRVVIESLIRAREASESRTIVSLFKWIPNSVHRLCRSTCDGEPLQLLYISTRTVVPVALSPIFNTCAKDHSLSIVPPVATMARNASCRPFELFVCRRIVTSATRQLTGLRTSDRLN
jgi:hypothetical protein